MMSEIDIVSAALCAWKEARNGGEPGMRAVICVLLNRAKASADSVYAEVYKPFQFSSMSYHRDPEYLLQPTQNNTADWQAWLNAKGIALSASTGCLEDNTGGATFYYSESMDANPPSWAKTMVATVVIGGQRFFKKAA